MVEVHTHEFSIAKVRAQKFGSSEPRLHEVCAGQVCSVELSIVEVRVIELRAFQVRAVEFRAV